MGLGYAFARPHPAGLTPFPSHAQPARTSTVAPPNPFDSQIAIGQPKLGKPRDVRDVIDLQKVPAATHADNVIVGDDLQAEPLS